MFIQEAPETINQLSSSCERLTTAFHFNGELQQVVFHLLPVNACCARTTGPSSVPIREEALLSSRSLPNNSDVFASFKDSVGGLLPGDCKVTGKRATNTLLPPARSAKPAQPIGARVWCLAAPNVPPHPPTKKPAHRHVRCARPTHLVNTAVSKNTNPSLRIRENITRNRCRFPGLNMSDVLPYSNSLWTSSLVYHDIILQGRINTLPIENRS